MGLNAAEAEKLDRNPRLDLDTDAQEIFKGEQPLDMDSTNIDLVEEHYRMVRLDQEKEKQRKLEDAISTIEAIVKRRERKITESRKRDGDRVRT